ncbi:MAG: MATE family efflux transporter [Kiritimatiellia bacterium]
MSGSLSPVLRTALPLVLAQLAFAANTFVTQFFLARHSTTAFHASLPGSMLAVTVCAFFINTFGYAGTLVAREHGAGDERAADATFASSVLLTLLSAPLFALAAPLGGAILGAFGANPAVLAAETAYFRILLANGFLTALAAVLGGYFTGRGRTRLVGATTVFGFLLNMATAPLFIDGRCHLPTEGVVGAGWSATIAHGVTCLVLAACILRERRLAELAAPNRPSLLAVLRFGVPNGLRTVLEIGGFFCFTAFVAECPTAAVAASTAVFAVNNIPYSVVQGLAAALEILIGRASGRRALAEVRGLFRATTLLALAIGLIYALLLLCLTDAMLGPFLKDRSVHLADFRETARLLVLIVLAKTFFETMTLVLQGALRGLGRTAAVCRVQALSSFLVWIPAYCLVRAFHPTVPAYWATMVLSGLASCALLGRAFGLTARRRPAGAADASPAA